MIKAYLTSLFLLLVLSKGYCLSENAKVSVLTTEPGEEVYTIFGHTAIRICDETINLDRVYNFGTFDFSSPFFYIKFLKGNLDYFLSVDGFSTFQRNVMAEHRRIHEQVLALTNEEEERMFTRLEDCYNSTERFYKYDFFYDNCATRVRDVIFNIKAPAMNFDTSTYCCKTFRQLLRPYIQNNYWLDLGINLALGRAADKIAGVYDCMFLPDYILYILRDAHIAKEERVLLNGSDIISNNKRLSYLSPWAIFIVLVFASIWIRTRKPAFYLIAFFAGIIGMFLLFIGFFSQNQAFSCNFNAYWTFPALIISIINRNMIRKVIQIAYILFLVSLLILWGRISESLSFTFIPWIITLIVTMLVDLGNGIIMSGSRQSQIC
jgi:hypothetical protein